MNSTEVPSTWCVVELGELFVSPSSDIVDGPFGSNLKASEYTSQGIPIARLQNIQRNRFLLKNLQFVDEFKAKQLSRHTFQPGDILISKLGDPLGKACLAPEFIPKGVLVADVVRARIAHGWVLNKYLTYQINTSNVIDQLLEMTKGTTRPRVNLTKIRGLKIRICSEAEQSRIVEKLEEVLTDLDAGVAELESAQKKLALYRQSLLKAAVEGALTAEWRAKNKPTESGAQLLERILRERRARWEEKQLAKYKEQGKTPPKGWRDKYPEPVQPNTAKLPELPEGWVWATLSQVGWLDRGRSKHRPRNASHLFGGPYPFIQTGDIREADTYITSASSSYSEAGLAQSRIWPKGTLCITIAANIGKTAILGMDSCFPDSIVGFQSATEDVLVDYVEYFMRTAQQTLEEDAPATAQKNINLEILERVCLPVPSKGEQDAMVETIREALGSSKLQERALVFALKQASAQKKNILKAAFSGELVPQDPNDEPASVLLERIRAKRAARETTKKAKKVKSEPRRKKTC